MLIAFELSMPNRNTWNGKWSGDGECYARVQSVTSKREQEQAKPLLKKGSFYYNFGDGWGAHVSVTEVSPTSARSLRKRSRGFCGYDWMIASLWKLGRISADYEHEKSTP